MRKRRAFSLMEVLVSLMLFSGAAVISLQILQNLQKTSRYNEECVVLQNLADNALHELYANLLQKENLSQESLDDALTPKTIGPYEIIYTNIKIEPNKSDAPCVLLTIDVIAQKASSGLKNTSKQANTIATFQAKRTSYLCILQNK